MQCLVLAPDGFYHMKRVLLLAYHFPPISNIGSLRPFRMAKYLPEFDWNVSVLTVGNDTYYPRDQSMKIDELENTRIIHADRLPIYQMTKRLSRLLFGRKQLMYSFLDTYYDWYPLARIAAQRELQSVKFDAILATVPPYTSLRIARSIAQESGLPCIADLRDPFTQNPFIEMPTEFHRRYYHQYEKELLNSFDLITVAWPKIAEWNARAFKIDMDKFRVITNGYEPDDINRRYNRPAPSDVFSLGYFGSIYGLRTTDHLFKAYGIAIQRDPEFKERSRIIFSGAFDRYMVRKNALMNGCGKNLEILDFNSRRETLDRMSECSVLVLMTGMVAENYPGKLFDYIASNRIILNISKPSSLTKLVEETGIGVNVDGNNPEQVADLLLEWFSKFKEGKKLVDPSREKIRQFDGKVLAERMAKALDEIL
jgi:glycosyltransferase involved in cell wall biosynthesis